MAQEIKQGRILLLETFPSFRSAGVDNGVTSNKLAGQT
jgi:hypothetical protein